MDDGASGWVEVVRALTMTVIALLASPVFLVPLALWLLWVFVRVYGRMTGLLLFVCLAMASWASPLGGMAIGFVALVHTVRLWRAMPALDLQARHARAPDPDPFLDRVPVTQPGEGLTDPGYRTDPGGFTDPRGARRRR